MAFNVTHTNNMDKISEGELISEKAIIRNFTAFEDGIEGGRFCWYDPTDNVIKQLPQWINNNNPAYGTVIGVIHRSVVNTIEEGGTYNGKHVTGVNVILSGLVAMKVTGDVIEGDTIYASTSPTTRGWATTISSHEVRDSGNTLLGISYHPLVRAVAYKKIKDNLWIIRLS